MFEERLPPDLRQVEQELGSFMQFNPEANFSHRLTGAVHDELRRQRSTASWKFTLGLAASALLWMNLSFYAASVTDFHFHGGRPTTPSCAEAALPDGNFQSGADSMPFPRL